MDTAELEQLIEDLRNKSVVVEIDVPPRYSGPSQYAVALIDDERTRSLNRGERSVHVYASGVGRSSVVPLWHRAFLADKDLVARLLQAGATWIGSKEYEPR